jgi:DNA-binding MarR family transcriptional regulator
MATHRLTPRQYDLLALLHGPREPITATTVADRLCLSRSAATELLTRAMEAGLVTRTADPHDARAKHITATPEGTTRFFSAVHALRGERARLLELITAVAGLSATLAR